MNEHFRPDDQIKVGDFVTITDTSPETLIGAKGTVTQERNGDYALRLSERRGMWREGSTVYASRVEKVSPPATAAEPEVLIDLKRLQAAHAAHTLLGKDALLEDLIGVSEFILDEHIRSGVVETVTLESAPTIGTVYVDVKPDVEGFRDALARAARTSASVSDGETAAPEVDLNEFVTVADEDADVMEVNRRDGGGVYITTSNDRGIYGPAVIVAGDHLDRVIAFLQAAKAADSAPV